MSAIDDDDTDEGVVAPGEELLPGYRVVELLSRGARIDTYDVQSLARRCRCVVKTVRPDRLDEAHVREAVLTEGRLLSTLTHPHLVRGYDVVERPRPAAVLETLGGHTLDALLERRPLGVLDAARLGRQLGSALAYLHDQGWLHLDVKPENVVVDRGRAILIDLSVAGRPGSGRPGVGTEEYLAPEQRTGVGLATATDVWGWGLTMVEALTGDLPPDDGPALPARLHRRPTAPRGERVPPELAALLRGTLAPDPAGRPTWDDVDAVTGALLD